MRKTKIVATIGPASSDPAVFAAMCKAGVNVARLNFSHGTHEEQLAKIHMIKKVREELDLPIAIMLDTKGPEYRTGTFKNGKVHINDGDLFTFTTRDVEGSSTIVSVSYKNLAKELRAGDTILVNNGLVSFRVLSVEGTEIRCQAIIGGDLSDHKSMSFPNKVLKQPYLSEQDKKDLLLGIENGVDFIAASFVSCQQDILDLKAFLSAHGGGTIDIIAKIENRAGVDNIESICDVCEGIMVARGDLGVEVPFTELPAIQKQLITTCRLRGTRVITATEMLESMIHNPRPTRARRFRTSPTPSTTAPAPSCSRARRQPANTPCRQSKPWRQLPLKPSSTSTTKPASATQNSRSATCSTPSPTPPAAWQSTSVQKRLW